MSLSLSAIDQAKRPDFVPALRRDDEGDRGFSDLLRDSVDRVRDVAMPERRVVPRLHGERAIPTAREAREVAEVATRPVRRFSDDGKIDATDKPSLTDVTQAKRKLAANPDRADKPSEAPVPAVKIDATGQVEAAAEPTEIAIVPVAPVADDGAPSVVDATGALVPILLPQPTVLPLMQGAGQDGNAVLAETSAMLAVTEAPVAAPIGFADLIAATAPISSMPGQGEVPAATLEAPTAPSAAAIPVPGFTPVAAPAVTPNSSAAAAVAVTATVVAAVVAPAIAPSTLSTPAPTSSPTSAPTSADDAEGTAENATGLPAGTTVTVTNQAEVLATKPVRIVGPLIIEQPADATSAANVPVPLPTETVELPAQTAPLPAETAELPATAPAPLAGKPVVSDLTSGTADDGLSQPLAAGAVSTGAAQSDIVAAEQPTVAQPAAVVLAGATTEPKPIAIEADDLAPVAATESAATTASAHPSSHASATAQAHAADQARFNQADATSRNAMPQHVADQVAVHIAKAIKGGDDHIKISLRPESLGQVEVQLKIAADGRVKAVVQIDKPETMELMLRDARGLERALQDAGLKTDSGSLSFNLRGQDQQREHARNEFSGNGGAGGVDVINPEDEISAVEAMVALSRANGGIDVRV